MRCVWLLPLFFLAACASSPNDPQYDYRAYLAQKGVTQITPDGFSHCRGYGCKYVDKNLRLTKQDWLEVRQLFIPPVENAENERERIAGAIALFEKKTGALTGTAADIEGTYHKLGTYQQDCVDESVNTTIYLSLLEQQGLLLYHTISTPQARVFPFSGRLGPHQTAVITEKDSGTRYAVDSWFHDNGHPAEIVALQQWFFGWRPDAGTQ